MVTEQTQLKKETEKLSKKEKLELYKPLLDRDIAKTVDIREGTELDTSLSSDPWFVSVWNRIEENRIAVYSLHYIVFMLFLAVFYSAFIPSSVFGTEAIKTPELGGGSNQYTNLRHPFGTDNSGRDILTLILAGTYTSMLVGIGSALIFLLIGVSIGILAGYYGEVLEEVLMRFTDFVLAIPFLLLAIIAIRLANNPNYIFSELSAPIMVLLVLGIFGWAGTARLTNATTKQVIEEEYVSAARMMGASDYRIIRKHIFPNILAPIIVVGTLGIATGILSEAGLTFLGFGSDNTSVSWGTVLNNGTNVIRLHPQQTLIAGFAVFFIAMAVNLYGDALRDALDPRLKK